MLKIQLQRYPFVININWSFAELYFDWVAPALESNLLVETWRNGRGKLPSSCGRTFVWVQIIIAAYNGYMLRFVLKLCLHMKSGIRVKQKGQLLKEQHGKGAGSHSGTAQHSSVSGMWHFKGRLFSVSNTTILKNVSDYWPSNTVSHLKTESYSSTYPSVVCCGYFFLY